MFGDFRVNKVCLTLLLLAVSVIAISGCGNRSEDSIEDATFPAGPRLLLETHHFNLGTIPAGSTVNETISIRNIGDTELIIDSVYGINPDTSVTFPEYPILPGETSEILVSLNVPHQTETDEQHIVILSNDVSASRQIAVFEINPVVYLGTNPGRVWFSSITGLEPVRQSFEIYGARIHDLNLDEIRPNANQSEHVTGFTIQDTRDMLPPVLTAHIELDPTGMETGRFGITLTLLTGLTEHPELSVFMAGTLVGPYQADPNRIYFSQYVPGQTVSQSVTVTRIDGRPFRVLENTIDQPDFSVTHIRSEIQDQQSFLIHFHSDDPLTARQRALLTIVTDAEDYNRVEIPIFTFLKVERPE